MPINVGEIKTEVSTVVVEYRGEKVSVTYNRRGVTPRLMREIGRKRDDDDEDMANLNNALRQLQALIVTWDVLDAKGKPLAATEENLIDLPADFLTAVLAAIWEDYNPNPTRPEASFGSLS